MFASHPLPCQVVSIANDIVPIVIDQQRRIEATLDVIGASSTIASMRELVKLDETETFEKLNERTNIGGSGISLGHPPGATGCLMITRLLYDMKRLGIRYGLQTMCVGGGHGFASIWELVDGGEKA